VIRVLGVKSIKNYIGGAFVIATLCLGSAGSARANGIIDPAMKVLADDFSNAILQGTTFFPNGAGGGVFGFFNPLSQSLTQVTFQTTIAQNLDQSVIAAAFTCNSGNLNPFFLDCGVNYAPATGKLEIAFWGTATPTPFGTPQMGIPPLPSGCISNPDADGCHPTGHFAITLSDTFNIQDPDQSGGWSSTKNPTLFSPGQPVFTVTQLQTRFGAMPDYLTVPEPAPLALAGLGLAALLWLNGRRRRGAGPGPRNRS
jgi:hypothetical protein